ncbi:MAG: ATP-binding cassette domain-containing protein [Spirochaetia bacterium]|nr:ATP-binding cassette domain-containing protein [Spirochaetia bacterium]
MRFFRQRLEKKGFRLRGIPCYEFMASIIDEGKKAMTVSFENVFYFEKNNNISLKDISFNVPAGKSLIIFGPENSGKETIIDLIIAKKKAQSGLVQIWGKSLDSEAEDFVESMRTCIGFISQNFGLINNLSVRENILLPLRYHTVLNESGLQSLVSRYLKKYSITEKADLRPQLLSYSEKLKTAFARAVITKPQLVLIEDALNAQCPLETANFIKFIKEEIENFSVSFIITAYNPKQFFGLNASYILMHEGEIMFYGSEDELKFSQNPYVEQYLYSPLQGPMKISHEVEI